MKYRNPNIKPNLVSVKLGVSALFNAIKYGSFAERASRSLEPSRIFSIGMAYFDKTCPIAYGQKAA